MAQELNKSQGAVAGLQTKLDASQAESSSAVARVAELSEQLEGQNRQIAELQQRSESRTEQVRAAE